MSERAPELPSADPLADACRRQAARADRSRRVDRQGWTDAQWCDDAERLMNEEDGAVTSLVNGHAMKLIAERKRLTSALATAEVVRDEALCLMAGWVGRFLDQDPRYDPDGSTRRALCPLFQRASRDVIGNEESFLDASIRALSALAALDAGKEHSVCATCSEVPDATA